MHRRGPLKLPSKKLVRTVRHRIRPLGQETHEHASLAISYTKLWDDAERKKDFRVYSRYLTSEGCCEVAEYGPREDDFFEYCIDESLHLQLRSSSNTMSYNAQIQLLNIRHQLQENRNSSRSL